MASIDLYEQGLVKNTANYVPLSPLSFLQRTAAIYPNHTAIIHGELRRDWRTVYQRCVQLADALRLRGVGPGKTVAALCANTPEMFELHFAVPMAGGVLNAINVRLDAAMVAFILQHGEASMLVVDPEFAGLAKEATERLAGPLICVDAPDPVYGAAEPMGELCYEELLEEGQPDASWSLPADEWQAIALNYTSGTTGNPKGVVCHHRGAYLNAVSGALSWDMGNHPVYLWTLPMFHCNGWCFPWTLAMNAGVSVCLRRTVADEVFSLIKQHKVTHFCGAPIVMNMLVNADPALKQGIQHEVRAMTAGAPPPESVIKSMEAMGVNLTHVYGLTETYGPVMLCAWQEEWSLLNADQQAALKARQGVCGHMLEGLMVADPETLKPVPSDGQTMGEVLLRGNNVMKGYLKNPATTEEAFKGGWFHSGDLAIRHPDGYIQILDRSKDLIISGGENISSVEIENALFKHPNIVEAAVVARSHEKWGEAPCAFVTLATDADETQASIGQYCRANMAGFKVPKTIVFTELPKTSTGKVQKFVLRQLAENLDQPPLP